MKLLWTGNAAPIPGTIFLAVIERDETSFSATIEDTLRDVRMISVRTESREEARDLAESLAEAYL